MTPAAAVTARRSTGRSSAGRRVSYREETDSEDPGREDDADDSENEFHADADADAASDDDEEPQDASDQSDFEDEGTAARGRKAPKRKGPADKGSSPSTKRARKEESSGGVKRTVIKAVPAPKTGHVAAGQISPNVLDFLRQLSKNNDREWFAVHDAVYRYAWKNFCDFSEKFQDDLIEKVDQTVPWLPAKDSVYRIYRDIRFSNDKTPYKTNLMVTYSRGGRKGPFAGYHLMIAPGRSFFAAGRWQPEKEDLSIIRDHILRKTPEAQQLRDAVSSPAFVKLFGPAKRDGKGKGKRCNLWGGEDELKIAPKIDGVDKTHPDIEWLKLRSFCAIHHIDDKVVLKPDFRDTLVDIAHACEPLVTALNSITSPDEPPPPPSDDDDDANDDQDQEQEDEEGDEEE